MPLSVHIYASYLDLFICTFPFRVFLIFHEVRLYILYGHLFKSFRLILLDLILPQLEYFFSGNSLYFYFLNMFVVFSEATCNCFAPTFWRCFLKFPISLVLQHLGGFSYTTKMLYRKNLYISTSLTSWRSFL